MTKLLTATEVRRAVQHLPRARPAPREGRTPARADLPGAEGTALALRRNRGDVRAGERGAV